MTAWLLLLLLSSTETVAISGIASEAECHRLAAEYTRLELRRDGAVPHHCIAYTAAER